MTIKAGAGAPIPGREAGWARVTTAAVAVVALLWGVIPLMVLVARTGARGTTFTGADGPFAADQLQYLALIRDASSHLLASNLFTFHGGGHVFLHPVFTPSGLLVRAGVPIQVAYLLWLPVAMAVLLGGVFVYVRSVTSRDSWQRPGAFALALLFATPTLLLTSHLPAGALQRYATDATGELFTTGELLGYLPAAISIGLLALYFRTLPDVVDNQPWRRSALAAAGLGVGVAWLHPWQGVIVVLATGALLLWHRDRTALRLAIPIGATSAPLVYYAALSRLDAGWRISAGSARGLSGGSLLALVIAVAPLAVFACFDLRRGARSTADRLLWLWPLATVAVFAVGPPFAGRALPGLSIPVAVLAVRACRRLPAVVATVGIVLLVLPGMAHIANYLRTAYRTPATGYELTSDQLRVLRRLESPAAAGGVLAPLLLSTAVPAFTGRPVWAGHPSWTPSFARRIQVLQALYAGTMSPAAGRRAVQSTGARFVLAQCDTARRFTEYLPPSTVVVTREGCVTLYRLS